MESADEDATSTWRCDISQDPVESNRLTERLHTAAQWSFLGAWSFHSTGCGASWKPAKKSNGRHTVCVCVCVVRLQTTDGMFIGVLCPANKSIYIYIYIIIYIYHEVGMWLWKTIFGHTCVNQTPPKCLVAAPLVGVANQGKPLEGLPPAFARGHDFVEVLGVRGWGGRCNGVGVRFLLWSVFWRVWW